ncbi:MAG: TlpA disulfide reductase family protein [Chitinophagales bacterium]
MIAINTPRHIYFLIILFSITRLCVGQSNHIKIGDTLHLENYQLTALNKSDLQSSKPLVIDFWATWCGPCIAAFPHLNEITSKYENRIQIIALSDEKPERVNNFIKNNNYAFDYFIDNNKSVFTLFEIDARPLTCLIAPNGVLLWVGDSKNLEPVIDDYLLNNSINPQIATGAFAGKYYKTNEAPQQSNNLMLYQLGYSVDPDDYFVVSQKGPRVDSAINIEYRAVTVSELLQDLLNLPALQFNNTVEKLDTIYIDLIAKSENPAMTYKVVSEKIKSDLGLMFNFSIATEKKEINLYELKVADTKKLNHYLEPIEGGGMVQIIGDSVVITRLSLEQIAYLLEKKYKTFFSYNGNDMGKYSFTYKNVATIEEMEKQLFELTGIKFEKEMAVKEFITIQ